MRLSEVIFLSFGFPRFAAKHRVGIEPVNMTFLSQINLNPLFVNTTRLSEVIFLSWVNKAEGIVYQLSSFLLSLSA